MNPEIKEKWLAALRSGEYEQGQGHLRQQDADGVNKFCCLGVLCELAVTEGMIPAANNRDTHVYSYGPLEAVHMPPDTVEEWAGLDHDETKVNPQGFLESSVYGKLPALNDAGTTFAEIADLIEEGL